MWVAVGKHLKSTKVDIKTLTKNCSNSKTRILKEVIKGSRKIKKI